MCGVSPMGCVGVCGLGIAHGGGGVRVSSKGSVHGLRPPQAEPEPTIGPHGGARGEFMGPRGTVLPALCRAGALRVVPVHFCFFAICVDFPGKSCGI